MFKEPWRGAVLIASAIIYGYAVRNHTLPWYWAAVVGVGFGVSWAVIYLHRENGT